MDENLLGFREGLKSILMIPLFFGKREKFFGRTSKGGSICKEKQVGNGPGENISKF